MYSVCIYCKEKNRAGEEVDAEIFFPHSSQRLGLGLICPWHGPQAPRVEMHSLKIIGLENKYKSIIAQPKDSLAPEGQRKDGGVGGWCKFVCL